VAETLADAGAGTPLRRLGLQDVFAAMSGSHDDVKRRHGLTAEAIVPRSAGQLRRGLTSRLEPVGSQTNLRRGEGPEAVAQFLAAHNLL